MRVKIINTNRYTFIGFGDDGNRVFGTAGSEFAVPGDLSQKSANKGIKSGFLVEVSEKKPQPKKEKKETATKSKRSTATK